MDAATLQSAISAVAGFDPHVNQALAVVGMPTPRSNAPGFASLARILVGQQLSVKAAATIHGRFEATLAQDVRPETVLALPFEQLRGAGLSNAKARYVIALAQAIVSGGLDLDAVAHLDEGKAMKSLMAVKGIGPWTAQIYLLFCEGRPDVWPAGDLAIQEAMRRLIGLEARPSAAETIERAKAWQPYRGAMAIFLWHYYAASDVPI